MAKIFQSVRRTKVEPHNDKTAEEEYSGESIEMQLAQSSGLELYHASLSKEGTLQIWPSFGFHFEIINRTWKMTITREGY